MASTTLARKTTANALEEAGFALDDGSRALPRRTIALSSGEVGSGKSTFWLGGPEPVGVQSFDHGLEGVLEQYQRRFEAAHGRRKAIYVKHYRWVQGALGFTQERAQETRDEFEADFATLLDTCRTIVWDKDTDLYSILRYAEWGGPNTETRQDYARIYARYMGYIEEVKERAHVTLGIIVALKDEWSSQIGRSGKRQGVKLDNRIRTGCERLDEWVFTELRHRRVVVESATDNKSSEWWIDIGKSHQCTDLQDQSFEGLSFSDLGQLLIPESTQKEWL